MPEPTREEPADLKAKIENLRKLRDAATPETWRTDGRKVVGFDSHADVDGSEVADCNDMVSQPRFSKNITMTAARANAAFIAAAANDALPIIDELVRELKVARNPWICGHCGAQPERGIIKHAPECEAVCI